MIKEGRFAGRTVRDTLNSLDIDFLPLGFELSGAPGKSLSWATFLKKVSKVAHERRGHNREAFARYWTSRVIMTITRRGAQCALEKAAKVAGLRDFYALRGARKSSAWGPLSSAEPPLLWEDSNHAPVGRALEGLGGGPGGAGGAGGG